MAETNTTARRGVITRLRDGAPDAWMSFQFNPTTMKRKVGGNWNMQMAPGGVTPLPQYGSQQERPISLELLLYGRESTDPDYVSKQLAYLETLVSPLAPVDGFSSSGGSFLAPPECLFTFGSRTWRVVVESLDINEEQFSTDLKPVRARVNISMTVVFGSTEEEAQMLNDMSKLAVEADNVLLITGVLN